jgi:molybdenum cofactor biosynthesis enzyme MoaA
MKRLEEIGFYTLSDDRASHLSTTSPMQRCEMILTDRCNFKCTCCRGLRKDIQGELPFDKAIDDLHLWTQDGLRNLRFSGGEPTLYPHLKDLVSMAKEEGVERVAVSTNGSADYSVYKELLDAGVDDFSISLDACCASFGDKMAGVGGQFTKVVKNLKFLCKHSYVTVGIVIDDGNVDQLWDIIYFADTAGVSDIRVISSAQYNYLLDSLDRLDEDFLHKYPILKYRVTNLREGRNVRGLREGDSKRCYLPYDDSIIAGDYHFPCVIYMREGGEPVGKVSPSMREERISWSKKHNPFSDKICSKNCLDVCIDYNNKVRDTSLIRGL